jgi:hypothetical protein
MDGTETIKQTNCAMTRFEPFTFTENSRAEWQKGLAKLGRRKSFKNGSLWSWARNQM